MISKDLFSAFGSEEDFPEYSYTLLALHNKYRKNPLQLHEKLESAAQKHAEWMAQTGKFSHSGENGSNVAHRTIDAGYPSQFVGENILYMQGMSGEDKAVNSWYGSPGHRNNMLNPNYKSVGFGKSESGNGTVYYVAVFGNI